MQRIPPEKIEMMQRALRRMADAHKSLVLSADTAAAACAAWRRAMDRSYRV